MSIRLEYVKRSPAALKDLQKVFFCARDEDARLYFDAVSDDLFSAQSNICIWRGVGDGADPSPKEAEAYYADLAEMNLFVVPVTSAFLKTENRARCEEFAFALERHIPVLPILQEQGLETLFNEVCGNLQMLNKFDPDPTALPYAEKLKLFMDTVLLKDETISKIRQAFAAYIFLSYRKKDRQHAQQVMRLIHKSPFARDIAIWYDEFLTPGEDFNESIRAAFEKSGLFSLVVTPNLLEDPNYVMTTEYPMARAAGKRVMPVMAVPTAGDALERCYPGLPRPIPADEASAGQIEALIREALEVRPNDDPGHKFFMGLAYLTGVDLETDHERALALITDAAEAGVDAACVKLVAMYENAQGVARDYEKAAQWQQRYVENLEKRLAAGSAEKDLAYTFFRAANLAGQKWSALYRYDEAWAMFHKVLDGESASLSTKARIAYLETCMCAANLAMKQRDFGQAEAFINKGISLSASISFFLNRAEQRKSGGSDRSDYFMLMYRASFVAMQADLTYREKNYAKAARQCEMAIPLLKEAVSGEAEMSKAGRSQRPMAKTLLKLYGTLAYALWKTANGDRAVLRAAKAYAQSSLDLKNRLIDENVPLDDLDHTSIARVALMQACLALGEPDEAEAAAKEMLAMAQERYERLESIYAARLVASAHVFLSDVAQKRGDLDAEAQALRAALAIEEEMGARIGTQYVAQSLKEYTYQMTKNARARGRWDEQLAWTQKLERVVLEHYPNDAAAFSQVAFAYCQQKDAERLARSYEYYDRAADLAPDVEQHKKNLGITEKQLIDAIMAQGRAGDAEALECLHARLSALAGANPWKAGYARLRDRAESDLAFALSKRADLADKERACEYYADLAFRHPEAPVHADNLRITRAQVALIYYNQAKEGDRDAAERAFALYDRLACDHPDRDYRKYANYVKQHFLSE